ncbi:hypothetical protein U5907_02275 [Bacteroidales bacterium MB20-C3-3]|nr:hypothetical protein U5907_02275 [Bacteroidales bacterium MB20-C3-3]
MINFEAILREKVISKTEIAQKMGIERANVNRTLSRYQKILIEIDDFLKLLNTSLPEQLLKSEEVAYERMDRGERLLEENQTNSNYQKLYLDALTFIQRQADTIISQQKTIEALVEVSKKAKSA